MAGLTFTPWAVFGGVMAGFENLIKQTSSVIADRKAKHFIEALDEVNWVSFAFDTLLGIGGGWALGAGGVVQVGALLGVLGYFGGIFALNISGKSVNPSARDLFANAFFGGVLSYANAGLGELMNMLGMTFVEKAAVYGFIGVESLAVQHVLTDDNPLQNSQEEASLLWGGLNALSVITEQPGILMTILANTVINTTTGSVDS